MKNGKILRKLLSAVCCLAMVVTMLPIVPAAAAEDTLLIAPNPNAGTAISGGSLSSFSDAAEITYTKAAEVTAGLGLFAGAGGKFMPKSNLTRAQMATIIVKMLNGSDANADAFKGTGKFSDTAIFEGGWAEGYINWCATLGIVSGYGDGTFKPGNMVTAAEAATMILNALKVDAGQGEWPHTVMAKAEELDMFDDFLAKPASDKPLTREELAVVALVGLEYSPEGKQGYMYDGKFYENYMDAYMIAGGNADKIELSGGDTLAGKVFEMKIFEGFVTANAATDTDLDYTVVTNREGMEKSISIQTGLEHIGHWVTAYYAEEYESEEEPGVAYTIYDETQVFTVADEDIDTAKEYKALFGKNFRLNTNGIAMFDGQYVMADDLASEIDGYVAGGNAPMGTYFVHEGAIVAYMAPVTVYASKVSAVNNYEGSETVTLKGVMAPVSNAEEDDCVVEYKGIAKDDYVTYTVVGEGANAIYVLTKAEAVTGTVSKLTTNENGQRVVTVGGKQYVAFGTDNNDAGLETADVTDFNATYTFYVTADGKYIGWEKSDGAADLTNAVFVLGELAMDKADVYGKTVRTVYARGVDMKGNEVMLPVKVVKGEGYNKDTKEFATVTETIADPNCAAVADTTFYYVKDATDKDAKKEGLKILTAITGEYDEKTMPIYYGSANTASGSQFTQNVTVNGETTFRKSSTINITIDGDVNQSTPLTATVKLGNMNGVVNNTGSTVKRHMLLSKNGLSTELEVIVICHSGVAEVMNAETVYIFAAEEQTPAKDANGYGYEVYNYTTGAGKQIVLEKLLEEYDTYTGAGFYNLLPITDSEAVTLGAKVTGSAFSGKASDSATDGMYYENVAYNQVLTVMSASYFSTADAVSGAKGVTNGSGAAKAVVVDLRDEEDIVAHGVGKIESLARIADLLLENDQIVIPFDLCYSSNKDTLLTVFVKDVYYGAANGIELTQRGGEYYLNGYAVANNAVVSGKGVTSVEQIYDLLNPEAAAPGYPPNEPADVELTFTVSGGKITEIVVTKAMAAGEYCVEDFEAYTTGEFYNNPVALEKGWTFGGDGTLSAKIVSKSGNQYLTINASKPTFLPAGSTVADGAFNFSFDFMRTATASGLFYVQMGSYSASGSTKYINFFAMENGVFGLLDSGNAGGQNFAVLSNGTLNPTGQSNSTAFGNGSAKKLAANTWYRVDMIVNAETDKVQLKVSERDDADTVLCSVTKEFANDFNNRALTIQTQAASAIGTGSAPAVALDNISYKAVSDWKYAIDVENPQGGTVTASPAKAATGETVTLSCTMENAQEYALAYFTVDGQPIEGNTFTMGTDPVTVSAVLERSYAVTVNQPNGAAVTTNYEYAAAGAEVTLTATLTGGYYKLASVTVNGQAAEITGKLTAKFEMPAAAADVVVTLADDSVVLDDDFSAYNAGKFDRVVAKDVGKEYPYGLGTGATAEVTAAGELKATGGRVLLGCYNTELNGKTFIMEFDVKRPSNAANTIVRIGNDAGHGTNAGDVRLYINGSGKVYFKTECTSNSTKYLHTDNTLGATAANDVVVIADAWWHVELQVNSATGEITVSIGQKGSNTVYTGVYNVGKAMDYSNYTKGAACLLDINTSSGAAPQLVDNIKITKVWED